MPRAAKALKRSTVSPQEGSYDAILSAAETLFTTKGYEDTGVREIAQEAGTAAGSLYYHFGSKEALFLAMCTGYSARQEERMRDAVRTLRAAGITDGRRLTVGTTWAYLRGVWAERGIAKVLAEGKTPSGYGAYSWEVSAEWSRRSESLIAGGPSPLSVTVTASAITGAVSGWAKDLCNLTTEEDAEAFIEEALVIVGSILGLPPEKSDGYRHSIPATPLMSFNAVRNGSNVAELADNS